MRTLEIFLRQIDRASQAGFSYVALFSALAVPDICGALESVDGQATGEKYKRWFDRYVGVRYGESFTGEDCYDFRCAMLHQARTGRLRGRYARVIFVVPTPAGNVFHNNVLNDALNLDLRLFCQDMVSGALQWLRDVANDPNFIRNNRQMVHVYPEGLAPYIVGTPVIA